jgi:hypothetical protein
MKILITKNILTIKNLDKDQSLIRDFHFSNHAFHDFHKKKEATRGLWPFHLHT